MAGSLLSRGIEASFLASATLRLYYRRLTARGRYLAWLTLIVGFVGIDTRQSMAYILFAIAGGPLLVAALWVLTRRRPKVELRAAFPERLTAGRAAAVRIEASTSDAAAVGPLVAGWGWPGTGGPGLRLEPREAFFECAADGRGQVRFEICAERRGRYVLPDLGVGRTDPLGLLSSRRVRQQGRVLLAYPRFFHLDALPLPAGRRYHPGGVPLASSLGDSTEFVSTRDYREGDPLRRIHWRSWARCGKPVVKEYCEEYFARVALILDTYLPLRPRPAEREAFEAGISVLASIADHMSRSEEIVDIFAAGPQLYELSAGRSLGSLASVLDVLACLTPCHEPAFEVLGPRLLERLERLTTVVAVVLDWDDGRERFLRQLRGRGIAVRVFLVRGTKARRQTAAAEAELGAITHITPKEVEERIAASTAAPSAS